MERSKSIALAILALSVALAAIHPGVAEEGGEEIPIGKYLQFGLMHDLSQQHVTPHAGALNVEGPIFTAELHVSVQFLDQALGAWSSDEPFAPTDAHAVVQGKSAAFRQLELDAILEIESNSEYINKYDRQEFPFLCGWPFRTCLTDTASNRNQYWPSEVAIKDVVTWGTAHKVGFSCPVALTRQAAQICDLGSDRFIKWLDQHAQSPSGQSELTGAKTFWTLVGARKSFFVPCDSFVPLTRAHGMDGWWARFHYKEPCYKHSLGLPGPIVYYQDASTELDGEGFIWIAAAAGESREGLRVRYEGESEHLPRTGHWLWHLGTSTWADLPNLDPSPYAWW